MLDIYSFTFNLYQENTFVVADKSGECVIIDPGCYTQAEQKLLTDTIAEKNLTVRLLLNTHGHIDHMLGNKFVKDNYQVPFLTHEKVVPELEATINYGSMFGLTPAPSPAPDVFLEEGNIVAFGHTELQVLFTPGHSAGHISFFHKESGQLFSGDVLFQGSIGRTDLPGGSYPVLMETIMNKILPLGDEVVVHCGHGPSTSIGAERHSNMFILEYLRSS